MFLFEGHFVDTTNQSTVNSSSDPMRSRLESKLLEEPAILARLVSEKKRHKGTFYSQENGAILAKQI